jgi:transposase-like protein
MRYPASEKLEIIRLVEQSHLPVRRTLEKLGIQPARFYRWYDRLQTGGLEALEDKASRPTRVWNRIPDAIRERIVQLALDEPELSPRELATRFTVHTAICLKAFDDGHVLTREHLERVRESSSKVFPLSCKMASLLVLFCQRRIVTST